jgi:DNA-binding winged helix-turn-helix (wHTH) protein
VYRFPPFEFDLVRGELHRAGVLVPLRPKALELLHELLRADGAVVPRETLMRALWPRAVLEDSALRGVVADLRDALGEHAAWLQYVARRGYCLAGRATKRAPVPEPAAPAPTLAVLPFTAPGRGAPSLAPLGGGLAAAVSDGLGRIEELVVRPFGSVLAHWQAANDASPPEPGLHSRWVLGGQVEQVGTRLHVHAGLRHGADGPWLWRQRFEAERGDAGHLATQIVTRTAAALATQAARPASAAASGADTASAAASEAFHRGRYLLAGVAPAALVQAEWLQRSATGDDALQEAAGLALALLGCGQRERARAVLEELSAARGPTPQRPQGGRLWLAMDRAIVLAALGEPQAALEALEHCVAQGSVEAVLIASEPQLQPLHGHPRFEALLRELGFGRQAAAPRGAQPQYGQ